MATYDVRTSSAKDTSTEVEDITLGLLPLMKK